MPKTAKDCPLDLCTSCAGWLLHTETAYMLYYAQGVSLLSYEQKISSLADLVRHAGRVVFFGGAGVSTESGIPDFRSAQGQYHQKRLVPAEEVLSIGYYRQHPDAFYQFYRENLLCLDALPNAAHERAEVLAHEELALRDQPLERLLDQLLVAREIVEDLLPENEEPAVDP